MSMVEQTRTILTKHARTPLCLLLAAACWLAIPLLATHAAPPETTPAWRQRLDAARQKAIDQVLASSHSDNAMLRANALEAAHGMPKRITPLVQLGLEDGNPVVQFTALVTIGKLQLREMAPASKRLLASSFQFVQAAAMFALHRCGQQVNVTPLAMMLANTDHAVRSNAAMLLGQMDDTSAIDMLKSLARSPMPRASAAQDAIVRIQVAEAIVKLGDDSALNAIRAGAYSQFDEVRVLAVTMLGNLQDRRMEKGIAGMLATPPIEIQIAAAGALARRGRFEGLPALIEGSRSKLPTARAQSAIFLPMIPNDRAANTVVSLLDDSIEQVRLSAAAGILQATLKP